MSIAHLLDTEFVMPTTPFLRLVFSSRSKSYRLLPSHTLVDQAIVSIGKRKSNFIDSVADKLSDAVADYHSGGPSGHTLPRDSMSMEEMMTQLVLNDAYPLGSCMMNLGFFANEKTVPLLARMLRSGFHSYCTNMNCAAVKNMTSSHVADPRAHVELKSALLEPLIQLTGGYGMRDCPDAPDDIRDIFLERYVAHADPDTDGEPDLEDLTPYINAMWANAERARRHRAFSHPIAFRFEGATYVVDTLNSACYDKVSLLEHLVMCLRLTTRPQVAVLRYRLSMTAARAAVCDIVGAEETIYCDNHVAVGKVDRGLVIARCICPPTLIPGIASLSHLPTSRVDDEFEVFSQRIWNSVGQLTLDDQSHLLEGWVPSYPQLCRGSDDSFFLSAIHSGARRPPPGLTQVIFDPQKLLSLDMFYDSRGMLAITDLEHFEYRVIDENPIKVVCPGFTALIFLQPEDPYILCEPVGTYIPISLEPSLVRLDSAALISYFYQAVIPSIVVPTTPDALVKLIEIEGWERFTAVCNTSGHLEMKSQPLVLIKRGAVLYIQGYETATLAIPYAICPNSLLNQLEPECECYCLPLTTSHELLADLAQLSRRLPSGWKTSRYPPDTAATIFLESPSV
jgi:hypothetical protein